MRDVERPLVHLDRHQLVHRNGIGDRLAGIELLDPDAIDIDGSAVTSACGGTVERAPELNRLAAESIVCTTARATAPLTLPSHASMLTGLYPPRHGIRDNGFAALPGEARSLAEVARDAV